MGTVIVQRCCSTGGDREDFISPLFGLLRRDWCWHFEMNTPLILSLTFFSIFFRIIFEPFVWLHVCCGFAVPEMKLAHTTLLWTRCFRHHATLDCKQTHVFTISRLCYFFIKIYTHDLRTHTWSGVGRRAEICRTAPRSHIQCTSTSIGMLHQNFCTKLF